ncbi:helix-turn-helix domain-containing protein [Sorangium sp. So ce136]|uniref:TetR/AcrR family transcriptional regulator n=1 Tax=Sorangium sp. So ce136 TaxID=3133284 RepID=UPI003F10C97C
MTTDDASRSGLRERSKRKRRKQILHAALKLFAERGYEQTTINDIAEAAEVAPRTVTGYFPSKLEFIIEWPAQLERRLIELGRQHPRIGFVELVDLWWRDARENVDRKEAALTRAMALANPGVVAMAEVEVSRRADTSLPSYKRGTQDDLLKVAGRAAISGVNRAFFRGIAEGSMTDAYHRSLLQLLKTIAETTHVGHGSLEHDP